ncbi:TonB-dependent receptor domain-containing protein [Alteromonas oceanisediminis]|uniref:TonB-dependent receptor domain-containing protein n=1 Tax=Alteromonas oceanisediminis TaxID=2836180 RepID=UPI001BD95AD2|nr:TonB-dependent receptor [Alteromonas oceanisediminis]MBT0585898.1 TonB-dependent receptor [Alteromonas oceanisediminis]
MFIPTKTARAVKYAMLTATATSLLWTHAALAQQNTSENSASDEAADVEVISVTGSRIRAPGVESSSPIISIGEEEIGFLQTPEFERIIRSLPATIPADGSNVNNGTAGAATINLRGLGAQRNLVLLDGRRMTPFNFNGAVDTATIPTALIERIDVVTGGASAVYGSDAIAGAVNVILKDDFEGVEFSVNHNQTGESDGDQDSISLTVGSNLEDGRGNAVVSVSWMERDPVLLGQRPLGLLGINSNSGAGLDEFLAGEEPAAPPAGCGGPNVVDAVNGSGSTTAIPTRFELIGTNVAGQFRDDRSLASQCSLFNFNPFNYYQTPAERYSATALASYEINEYANVYASVNFSSTSVTQQVAPSGTFGASFTLPLYNPLISDQARAFMIDGANAAVADGSLVNGGSWTDSNANGVVDSEDSLTVRLRRRTLELGPRTERFDSDIWQFTTGINGAFFGDWEYDATFQYGESNRTTVRDGYTNLPNINLALDTRDGVNCVSGGACVPIDLFGGFGTITEEMAGFATAIALQQQKYEQTIATLFFTGPVDFIELPTAAGPLAMSFGIEYRKETGILEPDDCLKQAPASCQGGAGGNLLPIKGGYSVNDYFFEGILPLLDGQPFADRLDVEFGFRSSDYDTIGTADSWKIGFNWRPIESLMFRVMQQRANRAPNVGELASPVTSGLGNATQDPCSVANAGNIDDRLRQLCISTGMSAAQVGVIPDIIAGQINTFAGSDPNNPPGPEEADTTTAGFVWTPEFDGIDSFVISADYYKIDIKDIIGNFSAQEVLDSCYINGLTDECAKINRIGGDLTGSAAGVNLFTTNLSFLQAEGIEVAFNVNFDLDDMGSLRFSGNINKYLSQESQSSSTVPIIDCKGFYGTSCDPISDLRWVQRTTWDYEDFTVSLQWRHISSVDVEEPERALRFEAFRSIDSYDYFDLFGSYQLTDAIVITAGVDNLFNDEPPALGNQIGDTSSNSGNTFPSNYDTLGRIYKAGINFRF